MLLGPIVGLYNLSGPTWIATIQLMHWHCVFAALLWTPSFCLPSALRGAGDVAFTMKVSIASMWVFRIGGSYLLAQGMGLGVLGGMDHHLFGLGIPGRAVFPSFPSGRLAHPGGASLSARFLLVPNREKETGFPAGKTCLLVCWYLFCASGQIRLRDMLPCSRALARARAALLR